VSVIGTIRTPRSAPRLDRRYKVEGPSGIGTGSLIVSTMATHVHLPVIPVNPQEKHAQAIVDYAVEANVLQHVRMNRWLALDIGSFRVARFNWVVFTFASAVLWAFVIGVMASEQKDAEGAKFNGALKVFAIWQKWITQNFTWLYIGTQVCVVFLALCARQHRLCGVHHPDLAKNATLPK